MPVKELKKELLDILEKEDPKVKALAEYETLEKALKDEKTTIKDFTPQLDNLAQKIIDTHIYSKKPMDCPLGITKTMNKFMNKFELDSYRALEIVKQDDFRQELEAALKEDFGDNHKKNSKIPEYKALHEALKDKKSINDLCPLVDAFIKQIGAAESPTMWQGGHIGALGEFKHTYRNEFATATKKAPQNLQHNKNN